MPRHEQECKRLSKFRRHTSVSDKGFYICSWTLNIFLFGFLPLCDINMAVSVCVCVFGLSILAEQAQQFLSHTWSNFFEAHFNSITWNLPKHFTNNRTGIYNILSKTCYHDRIIFDQLLRTWSKSLMILTAQEGSQNFFVVARIKNFEKVLGVGSKT